ncbi:MAG: amino acid permease [Candidatus Promineifilaceae bacterium]|nr:amino acid permease [Candidatus Promineifilaceae bacterium]
MSKKLERDLGLYAVITISLGAMIGSGIFVLPGIASTIAGPAVILAYLLAGFIVLPAALSKAEMATAMPESGGTYLYIDRAMGPRLGTIAGIGAWFSLVFKSAFALVGLGAYLLLFTDSIPTKGVALLLALLLIGVNVLGVKQTGRLQSIIVSAVLLVLIFFVADGLTYVEQDHYHPFFDLGLDGLLAATGFVFVSYAGVTKIASVAEEVENPGRNIPIGILASVVVMMLVYTLIVFVIVGVNPVGELGKTLTPMADSAQQFLGTVGLILIVITAVLALTSMANAGILSSSRYPFAMSRNRLAPPILQSINSRFRTPIPSILATGLPILFLIAFIPVQDLAKLASAFQILVFSMINVALIAFRESERIEYKPVFRSPGYPWVQLAGVAGGVVLLLFMGTVPLVGAVGIILAGVLWYRFYGQERASREGAALDAARGRTEKRTIEETRVAVGAYRILIPIRRATKVEEIETLLHVAADVIRGRGGQIQVIQFEQVPDQMSLRAAAESERPEDVAFERSVNQLADELGVPVQVGEIVSHDTPRAICNFVEHENNNLVLTEVGDETRRIWPFGDDVEWLMDHVPCDSLIMKNRGLTEIDNIVVISNRGPIDPLKVVVANAIAAHDRASIQFVQAVGEGASDAQIASIRAYHEQLDELCAVPTESRVVRVDSSNGPSQDLFADADLIVMNASQHRFFHRGTFGELEDWITERADCTVILVHSHRSPRHTFLHNVVQRFIYE